MNILIIKQVSVGSLEIIINIVCRSPSLSKLTSIIFNMELTHLGSEVSNYLINFTILGLCFILVHECVFLFLTFCLFDKIKKWKLIFRFKYTVKKWFFVNAAAIHIELVCQK